MIWKQQHRFHSNCYKIGVCISSWFFLENYWLWGASLMNLSFVVWWVLYYSGYDLSVLFFLPFETCTLLIISHYLFWKPIDESYTEVFDNENNQNIIFHSKLICHISFYTERHENSCTKCHQRIRFWRIMKYDTRERWVEQK